MLLRALSSYIFSLFGTSVPGSYRKAIYSKKTNAKKRIKHDRRKTLWNIHINQSIPFAKKMLPEREKERERDTVKESKGKSGRKFKVLLRKRETEKLIQIK